MTFHIITIFPEIFDSYFSESILGRAQKEGHIKINIINLRDFTSDKHKTVDDTPFGGGAGMLIKVDVLYRAISSTRSKVKGQRSKVVLLSAKGKRWTQQNAIQHSNKYEDIILICGRYEGVDERILEWVDEEISIGDFVMTGGEIGAMTVIDSITRLLPSVLGNDHSSVEESHSSEGVLEHPHYTRPEVFVDDEGNKHVVPEVLLSGNHKEIEKWREKNNKEIL